MLSLPLVIWLEKRKAREVVRKRGRGAGRVEGERKRQKEREKINTVWTQKHFK